MKDFRAILSIICLLFSLGSSGQHHRDTIDLQILDSIDPNLTIMIDHHIEQMDSSDRNDLADEYILVKLFDIFWGTSWIPANVIDSIYDDNQLPPDYLAPGYSVVVSNVPRDHPYISLIRNDVSKFIFKYKGYDIILTSNLNLNIDHRKDTQRVIHLPNYDNVTDYQITNYHYSFQGIWLEHSQKLK